MERLENRVAFASDLAADFIDTAAVYGVAGQSLSIMATVKNIGDTSSGDFSVEYRLSTDSAITSTDILLASQLWSSLATNASTSTSTVITVPNTVVHGDYYLGLRIIPNAAVGDASSTNNVRADTSTTEILSTSLNGTVVYSGTSRAVSIRSYVSATTPIFDDRPTWIVIHGRNSSPASSNLVALASALDGYQPTDQVLTLDWSAAAASGLIGGAGENYIIPVGTWAASALGTYGLNSAELNLAGHSWGAYVAAELAERMPAIDGAPGGLVNTIIALDPAVDYPGGSYNPTATNEVNFSRNSNFSWAFFATGGSYGSAVTARTADEAFVVARSDHSKLVNVVANLISISYTSPINPVGAQFSLGRLLNWQPNTLWRANAYDSSGKRSATGTFEAVISATSTGVGAASLRFFNGTSELTYYA